MLPKKWLYVVIPVALLGLVVCQTRTAWLGLLGSVIVHRLITTRLLRRPMLLIFGVLSSFAVVVTVGDSGRASRKCRCLLERACQPVRNRGYHVGAHVGLEAFRQKPPRPLAARDRLRVRDFQPQRLDER